MDHPRNAPPSSVSSSFPAGPDAVGEAVALAQVFAVAEALDGDLAARLAIVVEELVTNLIDHGAHPDNARIDVELSHGSDGVRLVLTDSGAPFDPRSAAAPADLPPERGGGAGLALVHAWTHIESYVRIGGYNRLELRLAEDAG